MKAKITKGKNFRDIINYIFSPGDKNKSERADWIGGTLASDNAQGLIREFNTVLRLRPHIEKPSWHCSLTLPPGEQLSDADWESVVEYFMKKMEFSEHTPYTIVRHNDTEFDHVHVVASRIPMTGPVWTGKNDVFKAIAATQELEKEYNLTQTPGYSKRESARETYRERQKAERTGVTPPRIQLQELIDKAIADKPTAPQFVKRLENEGVEVRVYPASTDGLSGFSFELDGIYFKGSSLGKAYGCGGLKKRGLTYNPDKDAAELKKYRSPVADRKEEDPEKSPPTTVEQEKSTSIYIEKSGVEPNLKKPDDLEAEQKQQHEIDVVIQAKSLSIQSEVEYGDYVLPRERLQYLIDTAIIDGPTAPQFAQRLEEKGVIVRANVASTGRMNGFSFELDGLKFKGSELGKAYGWGGLQKRGVSYDAETDAVELQRYSFAAQPPRQEKELSESIFDETLPETSWSTEIVETSPQQETVEISHTGAVPNTPNADTDSIEAAKLEAALNAFEEIFSYNEALGRSRAEAEFYSKTAPKEDKAQQHSTEVASQITTPEATQPLIESSALSQTPQTEAAPEPTQQPEEIQPLIEQNQQQQWVDALAPDFVELLHYVQKSELKGKRRTIAWDSEQQRLTVRENKTQKIIMDAEWDGERWQDNSSTLSHADFNEIRQALDEWLADREQELRHQQRSTPKELER